MQFLTLHDIVGMHEAILRKGGGAPGILNVGLIEAALDRAQWGPFFAPPRLADRTALLMRGIGQDHPFTDGNKRTALAAADAFLELNGARLAATQDDLVTLMLAVAQGHLSLHQLSQWVDAHATTLNKED